MNTQTESRNDVEALRLADELEVRGFLGTTATQAADELRRLHGKVQEQNTIIDQRNAMLSNLHALNTELLEALTEMLEYSGLIEERCDCVATNKARAAIARAEGTYKAEGITP